MLFLFLTPSSPSSRAKPSTATKDFSLLDLLPRTLPEAGFLRFAQNDTKQKIRREIASRRSLREYSGQALRLQRLPLRMTRGPGGSVVAGGEEPNPLTPFPLKE